MNMEFQRERQKIDNNNVFIKSNTTISGSVEFYDVTGPLWNIFYIELKKGVFQWKTINGIVTPKSNKFFIFLPENTACIDLYEDAEIELVGLYSNSECPISEGRPFYFDLYDQDAPSTYEDLTSLLNTDFEPNYIDYNPSPESLGAKFKAIIDKRFAEGIEIADVCEESGKAPAVVSRTFKKNFGFTPKLYMNMVRMSFGEFLLGIDREIKDVIFEVGFKDFSRFYKVFKKKLKDTPKGIKTLIKENE